MANIGIGAGLPFVPAETHCVCPPPTIPREHPMEPLTTLDELRRQIGLLACVEESHAPFVSCFLNLEQGRESYRKALEERALAVRCTLDSEAQTDFDATISQINDYLAGMLRPDALGVAMFSRHFRGGAIFLPMQFAAPLPN